MRLLARSRDFCLTATIMIQCCGSNTEYAGSISWNQRILFLYAVGSVILSCVSASRRYSLGAGPVLVCRLSVHEFQGLVAQVSQEAVGFVLCSLDLGRGAG